MKRRGLTPRLGFQMVLHGLGVDTDVDVNVNDDGDAIVPSARIVTSVTSARIVTSVSSTATETISPKEALSNDVIVVSIGVGVVVVVVVVGGHKDRSTYWVSSSKNLGTLYKMTNKATGIKNIQAFGLYLHKKRC